MAFVLFRLPATLQLTGQIEQGSEQCRTVILEQLDQPRLLHQAAELDHVASSAEGQVFYESWGTPRANTG